MGKALLRALVIGSTAFLTLVDLFATQAILPSLAAAYGVGPAAMGLAVNAATLGMALAGLGVAFFSRRIDRRRGVTVSLAALAIPTALLSTAFALTLSYLAEQCSAAESAGAFAAYITGNVASNLLGRLVAAALVDHVGLAPNFYVY